MPLETDRSSGDEAFTARAIAVPAPEIPADAPCGSVVSFLVGRPDLPCLAVVDDERRPIGIVGRDRLLTTFARQLMADLYRRRPIRSFLDGEFMQVDAATSIDEVGAMIATAHPGALTGGFVVTEQGHYAGIGTGLALLSKAMALSRLRAQQLDAARRAAEAASRAKSSFLATMSHEIRTPLNGVVGNLELLHHADGAEERAELASAAREAAQTLLQLVGDVLDLSKAENDRITLEDGELAPGEVVRAAASLFASRIHQAGLSLHLRIGADVPRCVRGDALRLRQIVMNFVGNAVKFTESGCIVIDLTRVAEADGRAVLRFAVTDTGRGFDPDVVPALFEPFAQEDASTTRRFGGTGLGLAICRTLVGLMDGRVGADGAPGLGALFWCEIPLLVVDAAAEPAIDLSGLRLLVFDGGSGNAAVVPALRAAGAGVRVAAGLLDGIALLREFDTAGRGGFHAALLDHPLPDGSGLVIAEALSGSPVALALTVDPEDNRSRWEALRRGVARLLDHPVDPREALHVFADLCGRLPTAQPEAPGPEEAPAPLRSFAADSGGLPVLVIDDILMNVSVVRRQLAKLGLSCSVAEDGAAGLRLAMAGRYALILVDGSMPVMDGYEFARRFRAWEANQGHRTPVVAMTAHALAGDARRSLDAGMDDHLTKPVALDRLAAVLGRWLPARTPESPPVDQAALARALGGLEPGELREVLGLFVETFEPLLHRLDAALAAADRAALRDTAHAAKGAAHNAAAVGLGDVLAGLEAAAAVESWPVLRDRVTETRDAFEQVRRFAAALPD